MKTIGSKSLAIAQGLKASIASVPDSVLLLDSGESCPGDVLGNSCIVVADGLGIVELISQCQINGFRHVIQNTTSEFAREILLGSQLIGSPEAVMKEYGRTIMGATISNNEMIIPFTSTTEKDQTMDTILKYIKGTKGAGLLEDAAHLISDEMFTNALFNAPPAVTKEERAGRSRGKAFAIDPKMPAKFHLAHNDNQLMIACEDPFGTLQELGLLKSLQPPETDNGLITVKQGPGGAGIGMRLMFNYCTEFYVLCRKTQKTVFVCVFPLHQSEKVKALMSKNFHVAFF